MVSLSGFGFSGWMIVVLSVAILTLLGSMLISSRKTYHGQSALDTVTLQVLNGCGQSGAVESLAEAMLPGDGSLVYDIIEKGNAKLSAFDKTIVVDRRGSSDSDGKLSPEAVRIADRLGIDRDDVLLIRLDDNILDIDVTVIAGSDYKSYVNKLNRAKEESL